MSSEKARSKGNETKARIVEAATILFCEVGYTNASVRKIASSVGIRESALYNHFKNKEEIFLTASKEIFASPFNYNETEIKESALKGKLFLQKFTTQYKLLVFDKKSENMFRLLMIELFQNQELRSQFLNDFHAHNIKILSEGLFIMMQNSLIKQSDPMMMAYEFVSTLFYIRLHITLLKLDTASINNLSTQFEKHVDFFWESIRI